jgi:hypothetical protein
MNGQFPGQDFNLLDMLPVTAYSLTPSLQKAPFKAVKRLNLTDKISLDNNSRPWLLNWLLTTSF